MKLYFSPRTRAARARWMLEELEVPYELVTLDLTKGEQKTPEYLAINPMGAVPALVDGDVTMFESAAIVLYLADKFAEKGLAPAPNSPERGAYYQWAFFAMATLEPLISDISSHTNFLPEDKRLPQVVEMSGVKLKRMLAILETHLTTRDYLLGDKFSAVDVIMSALIQWAAFMGLVAGFDHVKAYAKRCTQRPAHIRAR